MKPPLSWWREAVKTSRKRVQEAAICKRLSPFGQRMFVRHLVMDLLDRVEVTVSR
jgi:hypothetical protein